MALNALAVAWMVLGVHQAFAGKVLVWPLTMAYSSRIHNMYRMGEILTSYGHEVTLLQKDTYKPKEPYNVQSTVVYKEEKHLEFDKGETDKVKGSIFPMLRNSQMFAKMLKHDCNALLQGQKVVKLLRRLNLDVMISDAFNTPCDSLLAEYLDIPLILYSNHGYGSVPWIYSPSNLGTTANELHDITPKGMFILRLFELLDNWVTYYVYLPWYFNPMISEIGNKYKYNNSVITSGFICSKVSLLLINTLMSTDYPRPLRPHFKFIGGFYVEEAQPLPEDLEEFVQSAGDHGVIVMSFGTLYEHELNDLLRVFENVFSRLQQKVIWGILGAKPINGSSSNVLRRQWIPQNDLLGHPKTKLFISHCGMSATHESIYHGVSVLALPVIADQMRNSQRLCDRLQMGQKLDLDKITENSLFAAINDVLNNRSYSMNAKEASRLMRDQPMSSKEFLNYWVEYIIRYKGAKHFTDEYISTCDMSLYRYFQLDVIAFILFIGLLLVAIVLFSFIIIYTCVCARYKKSKLD